MEGTPQYPVRTFDPLLRDLITWGLVERRDPEDSGIPADFDYVDDPVGADSPGNIGAPGWRLSDGAQQRLSELVAGSVVPGPERLVYFDHLCARCHHREPTRLYAGLYLCGPCLDEERAEVPSELPVVTSPRRRLPRRRRRTGVEETGPLAS